MVAELSSDAFTLSSGCSLAKISMVAEHILLCIFCQLGCSLAKISMVAEHNFGTNYGSIGCSLAKISMVAEPLAR